MIRDARAELCVSAYDVSIIVKEQRAHYEYVLQSNILLGIMNVTA